MSVVYINATTPPAGPLKTALLPKNSSAAINPPFDYINSNKGDF